MRPGLEEEAVQGDGNCLCHSAGRLLHLSHEKVRESLVSEVENHQSDYIGFFDDENAMMQNVFILKLNRDAASSQ